MNKHNIGTHIIKSIVIYKGNYRILYFNFTEAITWDQFDYNPHWLNLLGPSDVI